MLLTVAGKDDPVKLCDGGAGCSVLFGFYVPAVLNNIMGYW